MRLSSATSSTLRLNWMKSRINTDYMLISFDVFSPSKLLERKSRGARNPCSSFSCAPRWRFGKRRQWALWHLFTNYTGEISPVSSGWSSVWKSLNRNTSLNKLCRSTVLSLYPSTVWESKLQFRQSVTGKAASYGCPPLAALHIRS